MEDIRKKLGLDYLRRGTEQKTSQAEPAEEALPPFLSEALIAYGRRMLEALRRAEPATARLFTLIDELQVPIDVALRVTDYLADKRYLTIVRRDLKGDHELRLTEEGRKLLG